MPVHLVLVGDGLECGREAFHRQGKAVEVPFNPHEEQVFHLVLMLVGVQDVGVVGHQEVGDGGDQTLFVRAAHQQGGGLAVAHV